MKDRTQRFGTKEPISASRVARRSLILAAVVCRGAIDSGAGQPEAECLQKRILGWLTGSDLWGEVEPSEEEILRTPLGRLETKDVIRATWYAEGLAILAWALDRLGFPRHDQKVDPYAVTDAAGFLGEEAAEVISTAKLRNRAELGACRELLYAIHARLRDFARSKDRKNFASWVEREWIDTLGLDAADLIVDDDLAIDGEVISYAEVSRLHECEWITCERHRAIIWLLGGHPIYSQTPVDT
jgi:hypothetical protein